MISTMLLRIAGMSADLFERGSEAVDIRFVLVDAETDAQAVAPVIDDDVAGGEFAVQARRFLGTECEEAATTALIGDHEVDRP